VLAIDKKKCKNNISRGKNWCVF